MYMESTYLRESGILGGRLKEGYFVILPYCGSGQWRENGFFS